MEGHMQGLVKLAAVAALVMACGVVHAQDSGSSSGTVSDTSTLPIYQNNSGLSVGGYSTTTTSGGYTQGGSGQNIPDNTRDSTQDTTRGVYIQQDF
jgi:hypothetical protein